MKVLKIAYLLSTGLIIVVVLGAVYNYFFNPALKAAYVHLGFPDWFRVELGIAKLLGAIALGIPLVPSRIKEWAYAGFFITFSSAIIAHCKAGDGGSHLIAPILLNVLLIVSYTCYYKVFYKSQLRN